jgi:3-oxoacyl-[acyl-carrier-protein] synthase-3
LDYASRVVDNSKFRYIAIVCSEIASKGLNPSNRETLTLFGDGAAAAIIAFDESGESGAVHYSMSTYSEGINFTSIRGGGTKFFFKDYPYDPQLHSFAMDGINLLRLTKKELPAFIDDFFNELPFDIFGVDHIIPHQASKTGLRVFYGMYDIDQHKRHGNLYETGNCISASIPLVLHEVIRKNLVKRGESIFLCGTSAGFALGGLLIRY